MNFRVLILGSDINAYTMARSYHEKYNKTVDLIAKTQMLFTETSKFCNIEYENNLYDNKRFIEVLKEYAKKHIGEKIILVGTNDHFINLIVSNEKILKKWYLFNYPSLEIANTFLNKSLFYEKYSSVFDMPKTYIYSCKNKKMDIKDFVYPLVIKPADGHEYYALNFDGQNKVFKVNDKKTLNQKIDLIESAGYKGDLIIQEFIPGDDSMLFDSMFYVNSKGKAEHATFAQIALQEHTKTGVGNCTVLLNGYSQFGNYDKVVLNAKKFLEDIKYTGFAEFDFKYDVRDNKYKLFEINPRQARCSYYFSVSAKNLLECLVDDLILDKTSKFELSKKQVLLSFVPKIIINNEVENEILLKEIKSAIKNKKLVSSLNYSKDNGLKRKLYLMVHDVNYIYKYNKKDWWS